MAQVSPRIARRSAQACGAARASEGDLVAHLLKLGLATTAAVSTATDAEALAAALPDRSRREYETGRADPSFKQQLNTVLLAVGCSCLCLEWIVRRLAKLA